MCKILPGLAYFAACNDDTETAAFEAAWLDLMIPENLSSDSGLFPTHRMSAAARRALILVTCLQRAEVRNAQLVAMPAQQVSSTSYLGGHYVLLFGHKRSGSVLEHADDRSLHQKLFQLHASSSDVQDKSVPFGRRLQTVAR